MNSDLMTVLTVHLNYFVVGSRSERSIVDLKHRYFTSVHKLLQFRNPLGDPTQKAEIAAHSFDPQKENNRREYVRKLMEERTAEEIQEEFSLHTQLRHLQQNIRKFDRERDDLLQLNAEKSPAEGPTLVQILTQPSTREYDPVTGVPQKRKYKKRHDLTISTVPSAPSSVKVLSGRKHGNFIDPFI
jgi:hypothetical protein